MITFLIRFFVNSLSIWTELIFLYCIKDEFRKRYQIRDSAYQNVQLPN